MAEIKFLTLAGLTKYDGDLKAYIGKLIADANGDIAAVETLVNTLIGDDAGKSVRTIANEELVKQLIPENAKEALDTLKEIADWIQQHPEDVATMNAAIAANAQAIEDEAKRADEAEKANAQAIADEASRADLAEKANKAAIEAEVERATGKEGELDTAIGAEKTRAEGAEKALADRLVVIEGEGAGSVKKAQADAEANAAADATQKVNAIKDTAVSSTSGTDITVTLGGTVGAPTVTVAHNFVAVTDAEIDALFAEETPDEQA